MNILAESHRAVAVAKKCPVDWEDFGEREGEIRQLETLLVSNIRKFLLGIILKLKLDLQGRWNMKYKLSYSEDIFVSSLTFLFLVS